MLSKKKILVTGANGLIGSALVSLLEKEHDVFALGRNFSNIEPGHYTKIKLDLTAEWTASQLPAKIDVIYHLAQSEYFRDFPQKVMEVFSVNVQSTLKLLDYARLSGCKQFIYASSGGVYGNSEEGFREDEDIKARNDLGFYLGTKFCSEILVENYVSFFDVVICRLFFAFGPKQRRSMLIPRLADSVIQGKEITIQGKEGIKINPIFIDDVKYALSQILNIKGNHKFNLGGKEVLSIKEIVEIIAGKVGKKPNYSYQEDSSPKHIIGDIEKMIKLLHTPKISFEKGVELLLPR